MNVSPGLTASDSYLRATPEVIAMFVNGCGPGGWKFDLIPDTMLGLSVTEACNIHDWDYTEGKTQADKEAADERFLANCRALIDNAPGIINRLLRYHRRLRALEYYEAVKHFGDEAFWAGKDRPDQKGDHP